MKINKKLYILFLLIIILFTAGVVKKTLQNDTYFYITSGEYLVKEGWIDGVDHWSYHENLRFTFPGWICDILIYLTYNAFGFNGIYILTIAISSLIAIVLFHVLLKEKNKLIVSFVFTLMGVFFANNVFAARNQIFSFLILELELLCLNGLFIQNK